MNFVRILMRHKWLFLGVASGVVVALVALDFILPRQYLYSTTVRAIGYVDASGYQGVADLDNVRTQLAQMVVPALLKQREDQGEETRKIQLYVPRKSGLIRMDSTAKEEEKALVKELHLAALKAQQEGEDELLKAVRSSFQLKYMQAQAQLESLKFEEKRLLQDRDRAARKETFFQQELTAIDSTLAVAEESRARMLQSTGSEAIGLVVLENNVIQIRKRQNRLMEVLAFELPAEISGIDASLAENKSQQAIQEEQVASTRARLDNLQPTHAVSDPVRSLAPLGLHGLRLIFVALILGTLLGLGSVIAVEWIGRYRREEAEAAEAAAALAATPA